MNVGVAEAKDRFSELIERAERGEPVVITRHGRPVATLNPARRKPSRAEIEAVLAEIDEAKVGVPSLTAQEVRSDIDAGRRY